MRCYICNAPLKSIQFDLGDTSIMPCGTCEEIINDTLNELDKRNVQTELDYAHETGYTLFEGEVEGQ